MELRDIVDENIIRIGLDAKDKDDALHKMAGLLYENQYIDDIEGFVKDVYAREAEGETGLGQGVAIPHGESKNAQKLGVAIVTLNHPIEWETLDGGKVDTIFLFCVSSDANFARNHMLLLSKIAARLADDDLLKQIRVASSSCEMIALLAGEAV